jgi:hypothetical protein
MLWMQPKLFKIEMIGRVNIAKISAASSISFMNPTITELRKLGLGMMESDIGSR